MPGQMPPPGAAGPNGAPQPPAGGPPQAGPQGGPGGGGAISQLLSNVDKAIDHLNMVITQSKSTSPQEKQMIGMVDQVFGKLMSSLGAGGEPDADDQAGPGAQGQTVPPEAGGNPGAMPAP